MRRRPIPKRAWAGVRLFAMDVDGILTDGTVTIHSDGTESKRFCIVDGLGLVRLRDAGVTLAWISGRKSRATTLRARELGIVHVIQGRHDKREALEELARTLEVPLEHCVYMGDDYIDAPAIAAAGIGVTVPGALPTALDAADFVTRAHAGYGAVREVCDLIMAARGTPLGNPPAGMRSKRR